MRKILISVAWFTVILALAGSPQARDFGSAGVWQIDFAPYVWATDQTGSVFVDGEEIGVNTDFLKFEDNISGFIHFEAWNGGWAFLFDHMYQRWERQVGLGTDSTSFRGWAYTTEIGVARLLKEPDPVSFEFVFGGRITKLSTRGGGVEPDAEDSRTWFEGFIGLRSGIEITGRLIAGVRGDIGGALVGSELTWNASGLLGYRLGRSVSLFGGYRVYDVNYETGDGADLFKYNVRSHGPFLGLGLHI
jgi:hypothetical protein